MAKLKEHPVMLDNPGGFDPKQYPIATVKPASEALVKLVLAADENDDDGRSQFVWVRLANGDIVLGVYPQGDTYFACEGDMP